jgi:hypothetical protein
MQITLSDEGEAGRRRNRARLNRFPESGGRCLGSHASFMNRVGPDRALDGKTPQSATIRTMLAPSRRKGLSRELAGERAKSHDCVSASDLIVTPMESQSV